MSFQKHDNLNFTIRVLVSILVLFSVQPHAEAWTILGTGSASLLGGDMTDPENDINDNVGGDPLGASGYDFINSAASSSNWFSPGHAGNEAALDLFDNKVGGSEAKWYDGTQAAYWVAVEFAQPYILTHFTAATANDSINYDRDPDIWGISGSNDGSSWTPIFSYSNDGTSTWTANNQVIRFDGGGADFATPAAYTWFRLDMYSDTNATLDPQLSEVEFFGTPVPEPGTTALLAIGGMGFLVKRKKKKRS